METGATRAEADTLANDVSGENEVLEDSLVNSSQSAAARTLLTSLGALAAGLGEDAALAKEDDVFVAELLLKLTSKTLLVGQSVVEKGELRDRHEDDDSTLTLAGGDFTSVLELESTDAALELTGSGFEVNKGLSNLEFELTGIVVQNLLSSRH